MKNVMLFFIIFYQKYLSQLKPRTCRFYPSCSIYTYQAIDKFGVVKGVWMGFKRILRCNPFSKGGYDPIPDKIG